MGLEYGVIITTILRLERAGLSDEAPTALCQTVVLGLTKTAADELSLSMESECTYAVSYK